QCKATIPAFIAQYLFVASMKPKGSLTSFFGQRLKKLDLVQIQIKETNDLSIRGVFKVGSNDSDGHEIYLNSEITSTLFSRYRSLLESINSHASLHTRNIIHPNNSTEEAHLCSVKLHLDNEIIKDYIDDVVNNLFEIAEIKGHVDDIHEITSSVSSTLVSSIGW